MVVVTLSEYGYIKELSVDMDVQVTPGPISATPELQNNLQQANRDILSDPVERTHVYSRQDLMALPFYRFKVNTDTIQILKVLGMYSARGRHAGRRNYKDFNRIQVISSSQNQNIRRSRTSHAIRSRNANDKDLLQYSQFQLRSSQK